MSAEMSGSVYVVLSVPARVTVLLTVKVLPFAIVNVALDAGAVIATLLIEVAVATPMVGVIRVGLVPNDVSDELVIPDARLEPVRALPATVGVAHCGLEPTPCVCRN